LDRFSAVLKEQQIKEEFVGLLVGTDSLQALNNVTEAKDAVPTLPHLALNLVLLEWVIPAISKILSLPVLILMNVIRRDNQLCGIFHFLVRDPLVSIKENASMKLELSPAVHLDTQMMETAHVLMSMNV